MKNKSHATKSNTLVISEQGPFRRFINQMFASLLKHQTSFNQDELVQRLKKIEHKIEMMERARERAQKRSH